MKIIIFIFLIIFNLFNTSFAENKIAFLNVNYIFNNSVIGKDANNKVEKKIQKLETNIKNFTSNIKKNKENLIKQKNILSEDEYNKKFDIIDGQIKEFNKKIKIENNEITKLKKKIRSNFSEELRIILTEYSSKNSIQLIIKQENVLIGSNNINITKEILKVIDSKKIKLLN